MSLRGGCTTGLIFAKTNTLSSSEGADARVSRPVVLEMFVFLIVILFLWFYLWMRTWSDADGVIFDF